MLKQLRHGIARNERATVVARMQPGHGHVGHVQDMGISTDRLAFQRKRIAFAVPAFVMFDDRQMPDRIVDIGFTQYGGAGQRMQVQLIHLQGGKRCRLAVEFIL